ncbi:hypothetical protein WH47_07226 [Habropoda laboriosa]|uniref:Uncharacterized protein n=1 Tax=Habropoda laboriosa TaxID=597456 RepID=A0A0L7R5J6_9HYME|nr:hypothetical protein WH47_07226 [Habropoda laboriosa]
MTGWKKKLEETRTCNVFLNIQNGENLAGRSCSRRRTRETHIVPLNSTEESRDARKWRLNIDVRTGGG